MTVKNKKKADLEDKLRKINEREKQLKEQLKAIDAREREATRKKETRAKIVLGGFIVARIRKNETQLIELVDRAIAQSKESDAAVLSDYKQLVLGV